MELKSIFIGTAVAIAFTYLIVSEPGKVSWFFKGIYAVIALVAIVTIGYGIRNRFQSDQYA